MSRIIHGHSNDVKAIRSLPRSATASAYTGNSFQSIGLAGTLTPEENASRLADAKREGFSEAEAKLVAPLRAALENVEKIFDEISQFRRELFKESEVDVLDLVRTVSKRVVMRELSTTPELMKGVVEKALSILEKQKRISIHLHSSDFDFYQKAKPDFMARFKGIDELELIVNPDIAQGTCSAKSKSMELDLNLQNMVDHLLTQVEGAKVEVNQVNDEGDSI